MFKNEPKTIPIERTKIQLEYKGKILSPEEASALIDNLRQRFSSRNIFIIKLINGEVTISTSEVSILEEMVDKHYGHKLIRL